MGKQQRVPKQQERVELSGIERLNLRVSGMINHPIAQLQRWVTIHRLDTDGDREWDEVMGLLAETDGLETSFNDDESVTVRWEKLEDDDRVTEAADAFEREEEEAPF
ncbi:DUF1654 domain-containing protein [Pseudomonas sp. NA-150]|uniref:DUF1654 domain-containing protein n=1 Tax=Pseudomonas sp. NA-150 TaxID=3367525 RepID=UPI0037C6FD3D